MKDDLICCRFCGSLPVKRLHISYVNILQCPKCQQFVMDDFDKDNSDEYWNARNEKFNPFIEEQCVHQFDEYLDECYIKCRKCNLVKDDYDCNKYYGVEIDHDFENDSFTLPVFKCTKCGVIKDDDN